MRPNHMTMQSIRRDSVSPMTFGTPAWWSQARMLAADASQISSWTDASGSGHTLVQTTSANQPLVGAIGSSKAAVFNGTSHWLVSNWSPVMNLPYTYYGVIDFTVVQNGCIWSSATSGGGSGDTIQLRNNGGISQLRVRSDGAFHDMTLAVGRYVLTVVNSATGSAGGTLTVRANGQQIYSAASARDNIANHNLTLGAMNDLGNTMFNGKMGDQLIVPAAHSSATYLQIESYLFNEYPQILR